jgi:hypothetical protein
VLPATATGSTGKGTAMKSILSFWCVFLVFLLLFVVCVWDALFCIFSGEFRGLEIVVKLVSGVSVCVFNLGFSTEALGALVCFEV